MSLFHSHAAKKEEIIKSNKVYYSVSSPTTTKVRFSRELEPGVSRRFSLVDDGCRTDSPDLDGSPATEQSLVLKLPPPPPCGTLLRKDDVGSKKRAVYYEDPFLVALLKCTKHPEGIEKKAGRSSSPARRRSLVDLSCKQSCDVREDTIRRVGPGSGVDPSPTFLPSSRRISSERSYVKNPKGEKVRGDSVVGMFSF